MLHSKSTYLDPRVQRTRQLLEEAFKSLLAERPCDEISVGDITRRAKVNRTTFYAHFTDIHHFATEVLRDSLLRSLRKGIPQGTPMNSETLVEFGTVLFDFFDYFYRHCSKLDSDKELNIAQTSRRRPRLFSRLGSGKIALRCCFSPVLRPKTPRPRWPGLYTAERPAGAASLLGLQWRKPRAK